MPAIVLEAKKLTKRFTYPIALDVLTSIDLQVREGETLAIMGASGEGKSTLLHILGTLETPTSGTLEIRGKAVTTGDAPHLRNRHIGFVFQTYNLLEDYTVLENVMMPARIARRRDNFQERAQTLVETVGLGDRATFSARFLSGGERQRVAIARALCNDPQLILADEPTGNLDRANAKKIGELLLSLNKSLILVTHDPELAALCQTEYLLKEGALIKMIG